MQESGVSNLVYSSSAAVYGAPQTASVNEDSSTNPESPYGETKLIGEWMIKDQCDVGELRAVSLRYFNVVGAENESLGDTSANNLVPLIFTALQGQRRPQVFGDDYPTPDGTCVRDYIDVRDLARAHVKSVEWLEANDGYQVFNVGRGHGVSVKEMMAIAQQATGNDFEYEVVGRRPGDPPQLVGVVERAKRDLGWSALHTPVEMVESSWSAWQAAHD
jgi:UDP-glucose 4-epimerase